MDFATVEIGPQRVFEENLRRGFADEDLMS